MWTSPSSKPPSTPLELRSAPMVPRVRKRRRCCGMRCRSGPARHWQGWVPSASRERKEHGWKRRDCRRGSCSSRGNWALGQADGVADAARGFTRANPFRERGWCALMVASYRVGRQSEAMAAAAELRRTLADELGLEPSPEARELEVRMLRHDDTVVSPEAHSL